MRTGRIITALATMLALPVMAADAPGYFKVPGTETTLKIYGYAQVDGVYDIDGNYGMDTGMYPTDEGVWHESTTLDDQWNWRAKGRFGFTTTTPSSLGDIVVKMEFQAVDNGGSSNVVKMRHCFGRIGGLTIGKTDSLFADWDASANYMDNDGPLWDFYGNGRVNQVSYAFSPAEGWNIAFGIEQNKNGATDKSFDTNALVAAVGYSGDWGHVRGSVAYQKYKSAATDAIAAKTTYGWVDADSNPATAPVWGPITTPAVPAYGSDSKTNVSWGLGANYLVFDGKGNITAQVWEGAGFYGTDTGIKDGKGDGFLVNADNTVDVQKTLGWDLGYSHAVTDSVTVAGGYGQNTWKKDKDVNPFDVKIASWFVNCQWQATKQASFGIEYYSSKFDADGHNVLEKSNGSFTDTAKENRINVRAKFQLF